MTYSIADIAQLLDANWLRKGEEGNVSQLLVDSRRLVNPAGTLFFALHSTSRDGHQFIPWLYHQGVRHFVVRHAPPDGNYEGANFLQVADTLKALQTVAAFHRRQFDIPVIGITGSNGKTIVKEWLNQLLEPDYIIVRSPRSYNSQIGVPLSVWLMETRHELGIFEAGISQKGEMVALEQVIQPTIGVFTMLGQAHSEGFASMEEKLAEKWQLFNNAAVIIYKRDDGLIDDFVNRRAEAKQQIFSWGYGPGATMQVHVTERQYRSTRCMISFGETEFPLDIPFADEGSVDNVLTCCAILLYLGKLPNMIQSRISALQSVAMRLELKEGINHCSVINDSYSADLSSLAIALDFLTQQQQHRKRTVILSDIPQSALPPEQLYHHVAGLLKLHQVNRLIAIGPEISQYLDIFSSQRIQVQSFLNTESILQHFDELIFFDETILVKGARSFAFENIVAQLEMQVHQTIMEIDLNAMVSNLKQYQQLLRPGTRMMAMVKAFSYGSGSFEIANLLQFHGVDYLTVAYTDEGVTLRKAGIHLPIMVMNTAPNGFAALVEYNLEPVLFSLLLYRQFAAYLRQEGITGYPVHLEMETGMNRLGFAAEDLAVLLDLLKDNQFSVQSVFSHFAASEDAALDDYTKQQVARFMLFCDQAAKILPNPFLRHIGNTAAIYRFPQYQFDMVRLGIGLYGIDPAHAGKLHLQEVSTLKTTIAQIKKLQPGETVGYNRKGVVSRPSVIATVRIGYADGYPRILGNGRGKMIVAGRQAPVIGSICMDMTMIDITGIEGVREGDEVVVFGKGLSVATVAEWAETIPYELLTGISHRVKRIYYQD